MNKHKTEILHILSRREDSLEPKNNNENSIKYMNGIYNITTLVEPENNVFGYPMKLKPIKSA